MRALATALILTFLLPAGAVAHESLDGSHWPTADELRRDLQDIGYEFGYDVSARAVNPTFQAEWPTRWTISETAPIGDEAPDGLVPERFSVQLVDKADAPTVVLYYAAGAGASEAVLDRLNPALMEISARLPEGAGIDEAVWYMSNLWFHQPGAEQRTTLPCLAVEFEGGAALVAPIGEDEATPDFIGAVARYEDFPGHREQVEACIAAQAEAQATEANLSAGEPPATTQPSGDHTVSAEEAVALMNAGEHTVVDVRTPAEYAQAHVVGAINIDVEAPDFADRITELDADEPYLLYCRSGRRSAIAADQMADAGFSDIADGGGLADLARAGAPVE